MAHDIDGVPVRLLRQVALTRLLDRVLALAAWLAIPVVMLLCAQWPLRDLLHAYSTQANDSAQICFALYVACAMAAAGRRDAHLYGARPRRFDATWRGRIARDGQTVVLTLWCLAVIAIGLEPAWIGLRTAERFPETGNPGYFVLRVAVVIMALLILIERLVRAAALRRAA